MKPNKKIPFLYVLSIPFLIIIAGCTGLLDPSEAPQLVIRNGTYSLLPVCSDTSSYQECLVEFEYYVEGIECEVDGFLIDWDSGSISSVLWYFPKVMVPGETHSISDKFRVGVNENIDPKVTMQGRLKNHHELDPRLKVGYSLVSIPPPDYYLHEKVPASLIIKSNLFIISKVGEDFFSRYITFDCNRSRYYPPDEYCIQNPSSCAEYLQKPHYRMVYYFKMPEKPFVDDELMEFVIDTTGAVISERDIHGIPDCLNNPNECIFPIDEAEATLIAKQAGLEDGIRYWETSFHWYAGDLSTYVWVVSNTLYVEPGSAGCEAGGKTVVIDANSGKVLQIVSWCMKS